MSVITDLRAAALPIGAVSELSGVNIETIRYYERVALVPKPRRTVGGRRIYGPEYVRLLSFIRRARELGFSLEQIRALIRLGGPQGAKCEQVRNVTSRHLEDVRSKISDLRKLEKLLANTIAKCASGSAPTCPVIDVLNRSEGSMSRPKRSRK